MCTAMSAMDSRTDPCTILFIDDVARKPPILTGVWYVCTIATHKFLPLRFDTNSVRRHRWAGFQQQIVMGRPNQLW